MTEADTAPEAPRETAKTNPALEAQFKKELVTLIPHLRAFARTLAGDPASADDLAQDAMMKAWDARGSYQMGTNMKAWTFMILRNQFYSEKRRSWRQSQLDQEAALVLVGAGGFAYEEAADICGCAVGTVKSRVSRARRALQASLDAGAYERDGTPAGEAMGSILADADRLSGAR